MLGISGCSAFFAGRPFTLMSGGSESNVTKNRMVARRLVREISVLRGLCRLNVREWKRIESRRSHQSAARAGSPPCAVVMGSRITGRTKGGCLKSPQKAHVGIRMVAWRFWMILGGGPDATASWPPWQCEAAAREGKKQDLDCCQATPRRRPDVGKSRRREGLGEEPVIHTQKCRCLSIQLGPSGSSSSKRRAATILKMSANMMRPWSFPSSMTGTSEIP
jgi:hypothetical protein